MSKEFWQGKNITTVEGFKITLKQIWRMELVHVSSILTHTYIDKLIIDYLLGQKTNRVNHNLQTVDSVKSTVIPSGAMAQ